MRDPRRPIAKVQLGIKLWLAFVWATPWCLAAAVLALGIVTIPISMVLVAIGAYPFTRIMNSHARECYEWDNRDRPMDNEEGVPWEM